jgi:hypothetical protein
LASHGKQTLLNLKQLEIDASIVIKDRRLGTGQFSIFGMIGEDSRLSSSETFVPVASGSHIRSGAIGQIAYITSLAKKPPAANRKSIPEAS